MGVCRRCVRTPSPSHVMATYVGRHPGREAASGWDRCSVTTAAFVVVLFLVGGWLCRSLPTVRRKSGSGRWVVGACVYGTLVTLLFFAVRRLEAWQREQNIEICRRDLPVHGSATPAEAASSSQSAPPSSPPLPAARCTRDASNTNPKKIPLEPHCRLRNAA